jgi:tetratricopeptide (TPR) repeat protein
MLLMASAYGAAKQAPPGPGPVEQAAERNIAAVRDTMVDALWVKTDEYWHGQENPANLGAVIEICRMEIELDPHFSDAYSVGAWLSLQQRQDQQALDFFKRGVAANPDDYELLHEFGLRYYIMTKRDPKGALPYLKRAAELPSPAPIKHTYAHALARAGQPEAAAAEWRRILKQFPDDPVAIREVKKLEAGKAGK